MALFAVVLLMLVFLIVEIVKDVRQSNCAAEYFQGEGQQIVLTRSESWGSTNI